MDLKESFNDAKSRMDSAVEHCRNELSQIRTGRATPALLDTVKVLYYGSPTPLKSIANVVAQDATLLVVQPFDKTTLSDIEKAIQTADLGINPANDGNVIRVPIPPLTEERRHDMVKLVHKLVEEGRISIRNVRKDINNHLRDSEQNHEISENESQYAHDEIQKITNQHIEKLNELSSMKEKEVLGK